MVLATASEDGMPAARTVLLKGLDDRGLVFFTNLRSRKGMELRENPRASAAFTWLELQRQVGGILTVCLRRWEETRPRRSRFSAKRCATQEGSA